MYPLGKPGELPGREHSPALQEGRKLYREAPGVSRSRGCSQASEGRAGLGLRAGQEAGPLPPLAPGLSLHPFLSLHVVRTVSSAWLSPSSQVTPESPPASAWPGARSLRNVGTQPRLEGGGQVTQQGHVGRARAQGFEQTLQKWQDAWT